LKNEERVPVLVAGGAGYIGSHVVQALDNAGFIPVIVDNLSTGNADHVEGHTLIHGDISDREIISRVIREFKIRAVLHFAAAIQVGESVRFPATYYENNFCRSLKFIQTCLDNGIRALVFSSTAAVYGIPESSPVSESATLNPINPYGRSKWMVEMMLEDLERAIPDFNYVALRYFNVAGADRTGRIGQRYPRATHLITLAMRAALGLIPGLSLYGTDYPTPDGTAIRDYVDIEDIAQAHIHALTSLFHSPRTMTLNCGYGHGYSVREVIHAVKEISGVDFPVSETGRRAGDPPELVADSRRLQNELNWRPRHDDLDQIIRAAWEWEKKCVHQEREK